MRRRVAQLGAWTELGAQGHRAPDGGSQVQADARVDTLPRKDAGVAIRRSSFEELQPNPRVVLSISDRLDDGGCGHLSVGGTRDGHRLPHAEAICRREQCQHPDPEPRPEVAAMKNQQGCPDERGRHA